jgi:hypothetical protein
MYVILMETSPLPVKDCKIDAYGLCLTTSAVTRGLRFVVSFELPPNGTHTVAFKDKQVYSDSDPYRVRLVFNYMLASFKYSPNVKKNCLISPTKSNHLPDILSIF